MDDTLSLVSLYNDTHRKRRNGGCFNSFYLKLHPNSVSVITWASADYTSLIIRAAASTETTANRSYFCPSRPTCVPDILT